MEHAERKIPSHLRSIETLGAHVEIYHVVGAIHGQTHDPGESHPYDVVLSIPLSEGISRGNFEVVVRGPCRSAVRVPVLRGRDVLHLVFSADFVRNRAQERTHRYYNVMPSGPRVTADPFLYGMGLALLAALEGGAQIGPLLDSFSAAIAAHLGLCYGHLTKRRIPVVLTPDHVLRAKEILMDAMWSKPDYEQLAGSFSLAPRMFSAEFRRLTGRSPQRWLREQRMEYARSLLEFGNESVKDVSSAAGFSHPSHFCRVFTETYGMPPMEWRTRHSAEPYTQSMEITS